MTRTELRTLLITVAVVCVYLTGVLGKTPSNFFCDNLGGSGRMGNCMKISSGADMDFLAIDKQLVQPFK
ncbi:MAG: hypothetical protein ABL870_03380, partial [Sediminibacterium sp.]